MLRSYLHDTLVEAGCDEAGRGPLAGPVVAAAVILPKGFYHPLLNDSKQLTPSQRGRLVPVIMSEALGVGVGQATPAEIDRVNILQATFLAMHRAIDALVGEGMVPESLLIDGNRFKPYPAIPHRCVVRGDASLAPIAAASVLAKEHRDAHMHALAQAHPAYGWDTNVGYPTLAHREAIREHGLTPHHRCTFATKFVGT